MTTKKRPVGKCFFCEKEMTKTPLNKHLAVHLAEKTREEMPGKSFLLKVEPSPKWGSSSYFLYLWADGEAALGDIDDCLRSIWLECCGHMSSFTDAVKANQRHSNMFDTMDAYEMLEQGNIAEYEKMMEAVNGEIPKSRLLKFALKKDMKIDFKYDFGTTTNLLITVSEEYAIKADKAIVLLSRNEPPEEWCQECGKEPAAEICTVCMDMDEGMYCKECAKKHGETCDDFSDYAGMSIFNSPRSGVCGYNGGSIDKQRDGVFVKNNE